MSTGIGCWLDSAIGYGDSAATELRGRTSIRGIGWVNGWAPKSGLGGAPVGMSKTVWPDAVPTNGLSPPIGASIPALVKSPHLMRSRRETRPQDSSLTISARFCLARSASLSLAFEAFDGR